MSSGNILAAGIPIGLWRLPPTLELGVWEMPVVLFDGIHECNVALRDEGDEGLSRLAGDLKMEGFTLRTASDPEGLALESLRGIDVLVVLFPKRPFGRAETKAVQSFVHNGGGLLLTAEWGNISNNASSLNQLTAPWGLTFNSDRIADPTESFERPLTFEGQRVGSEKVPQFPRITVFSPHPITKGIAEVGHFSGCSLEGPEGTSLAWSSPSSFADMDGDALKAAEERRGPLITSVFSPERGGRVVGIGDTSMLTNLHYAQSDNAQFLCRIFSWLAGTL